jgi:hypothetical protein
VPVTTALLASLRSLDDLHGLVAALGFEPRGDDLSPDACGRLGLAHDGLRRAAIVGRRGRFLLYGLVVADASREWVAAAVERLARATPGERNLLLVLDEAATTLAVGCIAPTRTGYRARQFRLSLADPSPVAADIVSRLAPEASDTTLDIAVRCGDVLAEEGLTNRFFSEFALHHERAAARLGGMPRAGDPERRDLTLVLLTRVLFLYFVQAKGWLAGRSDFLPSLLDTALRRGHPFHRTAFEPLCFGALAAPRDARRGAARSLGGVPFLNGGLFERHSLERRFPEARLPNDAWAALFDGLFERFRFTVRERDDADAVNPEMLGRVFEGLMARERRRAAGAYYTPGALLRETVSAALDSALAGRPPAALRELRILDPAVGSGAFLLEVLHQLERRRAALEPGLERAALRREIVRASLFGVDVDPMAVRLAELRLWLALVVDETTGWENVAPLPNLDQNLRQGDSLLSPLDFTRGARIPGAEQRLRRVAERRAAYFVATGTEKHRLARSIRSDERDLAAAAADATLAELTARLADATARGRDLFGQRSTRRAGEAKRIAELRRRRRELMATRRRLAEDDAVPFFAYDVHFGDVTLGGGFDVVLGNPPWVRGERLPASTRSLLARRYDSFAPAAGNGRGFAHLPDLAVAFVERALELAREGGIVAMLVPAKLLRAGYAAALRSLVRRRACVLLLDDRAHGPRSGFAATVFPLLMVLRRGAGPVTTRAAVATATPGGGVLRGEALQSELGLDAPPSGAPWLALPGEAVRLIRTALRAGPRLGAHFRPRLGVKTGANEVFVRPLARADELPASCRAPAILGRDISPFRIEPSAVILAALDPAGAPCSAVGRDVAEYLGPHRAALAKRADALRDTARPWSLFRTDLLRGSWTVLWRDIAPRLEAAALRRGPGAPLPLNSCYGVCVADAATAWWLAAWLNAAPLRAVARFLAERASGGAFRFAAGTVGILPLPARTDTPAVRALERCGREAWEGKEWDDDELAHHASAALGLDESATRRLAELDAALRGSADGDC